MKKWVLVLLVILFLVALFPLSNGTPERSNFEVTSMSIDFENTGATITVNYELPEIMKMYILLLGSKGIEPKINSIFPDFQYSIIKMNQEQAILSATNISRYEQGYYLHDSRKLGTNIKTVYIYTPDSSTPRRFSNIDATPYIFYHG